MHEIVVEDVYSVVAAQSDGEWRLPILLQGERAGPHEDCGGPSGYDAMVKALRRRSHPENTQYRQWVGEHFNPERFDVWMTGNNLALAAAWGAI